MKDYKLVQFKESDFKDNFGNTWCDAAFEGISEPVKWVVKDPSKIEVGNTYYGEIIQKTSKADKPYQRFYAKKKEESTDNKEEYWEDKNLSIRAQWAIGQAVQATEIKTSDNGYEKDIEYLANMFYKMVNRIKLTDAEIERKEQEDSFKPIEDPADTSINLDDIPF